MARFERKGFGKGTALDLSPCAPKNAWGEIKLAWRDSGSRQDSAVGGRLSSKAPVTSGLKTKPQSVAQAAGAKASRRRATSAPIKSGSPADERHLSDPDELMRLWLQGRAHLGTTAIQQLTSSSAAVALLRDTDYTLSSHQGIKLVDSSAVARQTVSGPPFLISRPADCSRDSAAEPRRRPHSAGAALGSAPGASSSSMHQMLPRARAHSCQSGLLLEAPKYRASAAELVPAKPRLRHHRSTPLNNGKHSQPQYCRNRPAPDKQSMRLGRSLSASRLATRKYPFLSYDPSPAAPSAVPGRSATESHTSSAKAAVMLCKPHSRSSSKCMASMQLVWSSDGPSGGASDGHGESGSSGGGGRPGQPVAACELENDSVSGVASAGSKAAPLMPSLQLDRLRHRYGGGSSAAASDLLSTPCRREDADFGRVDMCVQRLGQPVVAAVSGGAGCVQPAASASGAGVAVQEACEEDDRVPVDVMQLCRVVELLATDLGIDDDWCSELVCEERSDDDF